MKILDLLLLKKKSLYNPLEIPGLVDFFRDCTRSATEVYVLIFQAKIRSTSLILLDSITKRYHNEISTTITKLLLAFLEERSLIRYSSCGRLGTTWRHGIL